MPKISQIARFTTPVPMFTQKTEMTPNSDKKKTLPDVLARLNEERHATREVFLELIELALVESEQPLTVVELTAKLSNELNKKFDANVIRLLLKELETAGKVSHRVESNKERTVRAAGKKVRNLNAALWWAPAGEVPERTVTEAVPGIILTDESGRKAGSIFKSKKHTVVEPEAASPMNNPIVDYLVEKLVEQRTQALQEELTKTKEELEALKSIIRSAVVEKL